MIAVYGGFGKVNTASDKKSKLIGDFFSLRIPNVDKSKMAQIFTAYKMEKQRTLNVENALYLFNAPS